MLNFVVWGESIQHKEAQEFKEGYLLIKDENLVRSLVKAGTVFDESVDIRHGTFKLSFGNKPVSQYLLSYYTHNTWMLVQ